MDTDTLWTPARLLTIGGVLLLTFSGWLWWTQVHQNPYNVYWGMLSNSLNTSSVTRHVVRSGNGAQFDQQVTVTYGADSSAHAITTIKQGNGVVETETVSTTENDYVRYNKLSTEQKNKQGKTINTSAVLGKWATAQAVNSSDPRASQALFVQTSLGLLGGNIVPIANLTAEDRNKLLEYLHKNVVFDTSYTDVAKRSQNGRPIYTFTLNIQPVAYAGFQKAFAQVMGFKVLDTLEPNDYQGQKATQIKIDVDAWSHTLVTVDYGNQSVKETYSSYGVNAPVEIPKSTISAQKLQELFGEIK